MGVLVVWRQEPGSFAPEVVNLLQTFATQSVLAIRNAQLFREIADKSQQLEAASRHKSEFLASMSHELRTPLNAVLGFNEMILGEVYGDVPAELKEPLTDIHNSGQHLLRLINNVLDLSKIEAGQLRLQPAEYTMADVVRTVASTTESLAAEKGLALEVELGAGGHFLVLEFDAPRRRANEHAELAPPISFREDAERWHATLRLPLALVPPGLCALNAFAIAGGGFFAHHPVPGAAPDFHQPQRFPRAAFAPGRG